MRRAIKWMARNHVAANLLMILIIFSGLLSLKSVNQEIFPDMNMDMVQIQVVYPGATPEEVEKSICIKIEERLEGIPEIKQITSSSNEGVGIVIAEIEMGEDIADVKDLIKSELDQIVTFPEQAERAEIKEVTTQMEVMWIAVYGEVPERMIKELATRIQDDLKLFDNISQIDISGIRSYEISIEVSEDRLQEYGLTFNEVSRAVRTGSLEMAGGSVKTDHGEILVRSDGLGYTAEDYENVILRNIPGSQPLRVGDIATVTDGFSDSDLISQFDGYPAAMVNVRRVGDQNAPDIAKTVKTYLADLKQELPEGLFADIWMDNSILLNERIELLSRNAMLGLILVLLSLSFFLDIRLAFWVAIGIVISFMGTFTVMLIFDVTINMITLFAFILVLGIVVDDAIVVGENIFSSQVRGMNPAEASFRGAIRVTTPVIFAVTTSIVAFLPLMFVEGVMGKIMSAIPIIVISALVFSLFESLFILPAHLSKINITSRISWLGRLSDIQAGISSGLNRFINGKYTRFLKLAIQNRITTIAVSIAILLISLGMVTSGILKFDFMPDVDSDNMYVHLAMPKGSSSGQTLEAAQRIESAARIVQEEYLSEFPDREPFIRHISTVVGNQPMVSEGHGGTGLTVTNPELAEINIEIVSPDQRELSSSELAGRWRDKVGDLIGIESITYSANLMSMGNDIEVTLSANDYIVLDQAVNDLKDRLADYEGVSEIRDDFELGKQELKLRLKSSAASLNLTLQDLARQVRQGLYGDEVFRLQRGKDEVKVMVRYPLGERNSLKDIERMRIRTPEGNQVPFYTVAEVEEGRAYSQIKRSDGRRIVVVMADVDNNRTSANDINSELRSQVLPDLEVRYPGLASSFEGIQEQQTESMSSLGIGFLIALFVMYGLLAIPFKSYIQPLVIMSAVPFGIIGAVWGHILFGYSLSMISMFGVVALSGVVINDSLILVDFINDRLRSGHSVQDAVILACQSRFRPIILTSVTTFLGLTPIILETSLQARFLIPMALSLGFGVLTGTAIILIMVPAGVIMIEDLKTIPVRLKKKIRNFGTAGKVYGGRRES